MTGVLDDPLYALCVVVLFCVPVEFATAPDILVYMDCDGIEQNCGGCTEADGYSIGVDIGMGGGGIGLPIGGT